MTTFEEFYSDLVEAASIFGRPNPMLVAVSKKQPIEKMLFAYEKGQLHFGENYAQELAEKAPKMPTQCYWHFIGPIQTNKIKILAKHADWIHSLSSIKHALLLETELKRLSRKIDALIQINIDNEDSKSGITNEKDFMELAEKIMLCSAINLRGFMILPKLQKSEREFKLLEAKIKKYQELLKNMGCKICEISFGTSSDYQEALRAGSTIIRVGEKIFGKRN
ncbi:MAG: YggS family pyridoxal phosphate-dependent enzyme [Gammaproteobacteria bacterium]